MRGPLNILLLHSIFWVVASAETTFRCDASNENNECAFTVFNDSGATNFVLQPGQKRGLNDNTIGLKYCVSVGPKGTPHNDYPQCWDNSPLPPDGHKTVRANIVNN